MKVKVQGNTLVKYEKASSKLRMFGGSWTVKAELLTDKIEHIKYITSGKEYNISVDDAYEHGQWRVFQGEKKLIIPLKFWTVA